MSEKIADKVEITNSATTKTTITLDGVGGFIRVDNDKSTQLELWGTSTAVAGASLQSGGVLALGGTADGDGELRLYAKGSRGSIYDITNFRVHLSGDEGRLRLKDQDGKHVVVQLSADEGSISVGSVGKDGVVFVRNRNGVETLRLDGAAGDIILANADCAEEFDVVSEVEAEPGTLMVLTDDGRLRACDEPYDRRAAGVLSGAGTYRPGIVLDRQQTSSGPRAAMAMVGKVYCKVDASFGAIRAGDLLTSSSTPGHAMKAADPQRAFGAVVGKALKPLTEGCGMIPILVALQ